MSDGDRGSVLLSGAGAPSRLATVGYWTIAVGHLWVLRIHALTTGAEAMLFATLALVEVALALEAAVYAVGGLGTQIGLPILTLLGRVRLLGAAMAWPWLLPWVSELGCRCHVVTPGYGLTLVHATTALAGLLTLFYLGGEMQLAVFASPANSSDTMTGCMPSPILAGQFRLDKADLEETGRAVFVPAQARKGLYVGAGLALLVHLCFGMAFALFGVPGFPPWLLVGALAAMLGRSFGQLPPMAKDREKGASNDSRILWRREGPRLVVRLCELAWIWCCVMELQRCETSSEWLPVCAA
ncbi:unnamed protein product [Symbiodinium natans]|uniref:Uncharacterized protein n=1 Tax=Symbiodinium natans TaxID=878477 RepID=A0A812KS37_9DINO|nr:unnamed protein product [Symbiodinium natans]